MSNETAASSIPTGAVTVGPSAPTLRLEYEVREEAAAAGPAPFHARTASRMIWLLALLPGLVAPFLPFACNASPAEMVWSGGEELINNGFHKSGEFALWLLAFPFFLAFPAVLWKSLRLLRRPPTRLGRQLAVAIGTAGSALFVCVLALSSAGSLFEWTVVIVSAVGIALVVALEFALFARPGHRDDAVGVAMLGPYAMTLGFAVACWSTDHDVKIGWYVSIVPATGGLVELLLIAWFVWRTRGRRRLAPG